MPILAPWSSSNVSRSGHRWSRDHRPRLTTSDMLDAGNPGLTFLKNHKVSLLQLKATISWNILRLGERLPVVFSETDYMFDNVINYLIYWFFTRGARLPRGESMNFRGSGSPCALYNMESFLNGKVFRLNYIYKVRGTWTKRQLFEGCLVEKRSRTTALEQNGSVVVAVISSGQRHGWSLPALCCGSATSANIQLVLTWYCFFGIFRTASPKSTFFQNCVKKSVVTRLLLMLIRYNTST